MTLNSRLSAFRALLLKLRNDPEIKPPRVIWATSDGREKLPSAWRQEPRVVTFRRSA